MKKITALLLALVMALSLAACGGGGEGQESQSPAPSQAAAPSAEPSEAPSEAPSAEPVTLRIGYMANYASLWGVLSAINQGCFEEEGITIELYPFADGPSEIAAMEGGSIDLAYIGKGAHKLCIQGRALLFAPSSVHTSDKVVVTAESGIQTVADLKGKKIAYNQGSSSESTLDSALAVGGLTRDDVELYDMDVAYMPSAMASGQVDAAVCWNPYSSEILKNMEGSYEVEFSNGSINMSSWICLPGYQEDNRDTLLRFTRALFKGMDWGSKVENYEAVAQLCADETKTSLEANLAQVGDAQWFDIATIKADLADGTMKEYYEHVQQDFIDGETITPEEAVDDISTIVLFDIMEEAVQ